MKRLKNISVRCALAAACALVPFAPKQALAQQRDPAAAQALFDQARELLRQGRYAEACPKLLESNRLDPGIGTQFRLGECYEQSGQIATAWATFLDVASQARAASQFDREKAATKRAVQLEPRLPKLTINVPEESQIQGLEIRRDGIVVGNSQWGAPLPVDPGTHQFSVTAPGRIPLEQSLKAEEGKPLTFDVPELETVAEAAEPAPPATEAEATPTPAPHNHHHRSKPAEAPEPAPPQQPAPGSTVDAWPFVLASAGVLGIAIGTGFAIKAGSDNSKSKQDCDVPDANVCGPTGVSLRNDALTEGNVATIGLVGGAVLLATGGLIWDLEYQSHKKSAAALVPIHAAAALSPGSASFYLKGGF
jgi:hypothetical protein